jgi:serine/threonine protein phosphatase 1
VKNPIRTFEVNAVGRDFAVADLHGSYSLLEALLKHVGFDPAVDRLFGVGDLVDRGPASMRCLQLLDEPWFHAVLSNHEQMMLEAFHGGYMGQFWLQNGGMWGLGPLSDHVNRRPQLEEWGTKLVDLLHKVGELPFIMTVHLKTGKKVHLIHAELPPVGPITDEMLADPAKVLELAQHRTSDGTFFLWGRHLYYNFNYQDISNLPKIRRTVAYDAKRYGLIFNPDLSHIVSGHTILQRPMTIIGQTNIDTCAYGAYREGAKWQALTLLELDTWTFYQARLSGVTEVQPVVVTLEDINTPHAGDKHDTTDTGSGAGRPVQHPDEPT